MTNVTSLRFAFLLVGLLTAAACGHDNPYYCQGAPLNNCLDGDGGTIDAAPPGGCTSDQGCSGATSVCNLTTKACVQCVGSDDQACTGETPTCGSDDMCHACTLDSECTASQLCLPDGSCAAAAAVLYASTAGDNSADCSLATPCSLTHALSLVSATLNTIKLSSGTYEVASTISIASTVTLAGAGAVLDSSSGSQGAVLSVTSGGNVQIDYLAVTGAHGTLADGISCAGGTLALSQASVHDNAQIGIDSSSCTVTISQSTIAGNAGGGITANGGTATVSQSTVSGNAGGGVTATGGALTISQSTVSSNSSGGISVTGGSTTFTITNNFIHHNGNNVSSSYGGATLTSTADNTFSFNTVVDNQANLGAASAGGVFCDRTGFVAPHNIIYRNTGGSSTTAQTFGNCTYGDSLVMTAAAGTNALAFASPNVTPFDYHLTSTSPTTVVDAASACSVPIDFDGDSRPQGAACDLGADEYKP